MAFDLSRLAGRAEDWLRRAIKPKAVKEAEERRRRRRARETGLRLRRAAVAGGTSGAGAAGVGMLAAPGAVGLAAAGAVALIAGGAAMFWPVRSPAPLSSRELSELLLDAEEWLLEKRKLLPGRALPALDRIFQRLDDLHPHLASLQPAGTTAWEIRRIVADHLPRLVDAYAGLPETVREAEPELLPRLIEGLETCDEELVRLCREASAGHLHSFDVQNRFLEIRYRDGSGI